MNGKEGSFKGGGTHEEFLALCALSTSGELSDSEHRTLQEHLLLCDECRDAKQLFEEAVDEVMPASAADKFEDNDHGADTYWLDQAEAEFFKRLAQEKASSEEGPSRDSISSVYGFSFTGIDKWRNIWALSLAGVLLAIAMGISVYEIGARKGLEIARTTAQNPQRPVARSLAVSNSASAITHAQLKKRDNVIDALRRRLRQQSTELNELRLAQRQLATDLRNKNASEQSLAQERNELLERLEAAQTEIRHLDVQLASARSRESQASSREADLLAKATDLTQMLKERDNTIAEEEELLAHDRDIRELIGARDLHVAGDPNHP